MRLIRSTLSVMLGDAIDDDGIITTKPALVIGRRGRKPGATRARRAESARRAVWGGAARSGMNGPVTAAVVEDRRSVEVPGDLLAPLVHRVKLSGSEWRLVIALLLAGRPMSARQLARHLGLDYSLVKRTARGLKAWNILQRARGGLTFQSDSARWAC